jgi:hypothetical protein
VMQVYSIRQDLADLNGNLFGFRGGSYEQAGPFSDRSTPMVGVNQHRCAESSVYGRQVTTASQSICTSVSDQPPIH